MPQPRRGRQPKGPWAELAATLARRRLILGMTQRQAANLSDLSEKALRDIESGTVGPRLSALVAIAETLGLDVALTPHNARQTLPPGTLIVQREGDPE